MVSLISIKHKLKARLGELWWYTIVLFVAGQLGAVINTFVGLWLVPKYVPQQELGAVLPLASVGGLIGLPLTILMMPFLKFLSKYMAQGEDGKVKKLLRDVFLISLATFLAVSSVAYLFMPHIFKRMRVENGSLALLVISSGVLGALAPVFSTALQALKKFRMMAVLGFAGAFIRLVTLWVALPVRGLSGYFVGQITPMVFGMAASVAVLRPHIGRHVKMASYWTADWRPMLLFTVWNALLYSISQIMGTTEGFVIRHRLSDMESAGYYMISRFAEISFYISSACTIVLFPLISEQHERGGQTGERLLTQSTLVSLGTGILFALFIMPVAYFLFRLKADWACYIPLVPHLAVLCCIQVIRGATNSFVMYKLAKNEFNFIPIYALIFGLEAVFLYCLTGYSFFAPWLPSAWLESLRAFNPCRLSVVLGVIFAHSLVVGGYVVGSIIKIRLRSPVCPATVDQRLS